MTTATKRINLVQTVKSAAEMGKKPNKAVILAANEEIRQHEQLQRMGGYQSLLRAISQ